MRTYIMVAFLMVAGLVAHGGAGSAMPAPLPASLGEWSVSAGVVKALEQWYSPTARNLVYPQAEEKVWAPAEIPLGVRQEAAGWLGRILQAPYVMPQVSDRFVGVRRTRAGTKEEVDYLYLRYETNNMFVQVCEHERGMALMFQPQRGRAEAPPADCLTAQRYLLDLYRQVFQPPKVPLRYVEMGLETKQSAGGRPLFCGVIRVDPNEHPTISFDPLTRKRYWHDEMTAFVDGYTVGFFFRKLDGQIDAEAQSVPSGKRW
ncbi:MAG: hypothetical protein NTZ09_11695 [Candidatus Hydrogenedentes bacterium]|nr:hypothetical protein [Candidatus Hydrogenedentota bacterium]